MQNETSLSRFNSGRTTLVDEGQAYPLIASQPPVGDRKSGPVSLIVQTPDNKQWIDLDHISPKLLNEIRRQYDPSHSPSQKGPLTKGAEKIKAWVRQSKLGIDIRLRRNVDAKHDEITDVYLTREYHGDHEVLHVSELPSNEILETPELPDNAVMPSTPELPAESSFAHTPRGIRAEIADEILPRYEAPPEDDRPGFKRQVETARHAASFRQSPQVSAPEPISDMLVVPEETAPAESPSNAVDSLSSSTLQGLEANLQSSKQKLEAQQDHHRQLEQILHAIKLQVSKSDQDTEQRANPFKGLHVAKAFQREVETDAEPPSPFDQRVSKAMATGKRSPKRKRTVKASAPNLRRLKEDTDSDSPDGHSSSDRKNLIRRLTRPKRTPASAGAELLWVAVLRAQGNIFGPDHHLVKKAEEAYMISRDNRHKKYSSSFLVALHESKTQAQSVLGEKHPRVTAFSSDLATLETVLAEEDCSTGREGNTDTLATVTNPSLDHPKAANTMLPPVEPGTRPHTAGITPENTHQDRAQPRLPSLDTKDALWNTSNPPHSPQNSLKALGGSIFQALTSSALISIQWLQQQYGPEPSVEAGKARVRWTCSCGEPLYDDFIERRPGAARELEAYLNRPRTHTSPTTPSSSSGHPSFNSSSFGMPPSSQTSWSSYNQSFSNSFQRGSFQGDSKQGPLTGSLPMYMPWGPQEPPWLLTCANEDRSTPKISHLDMNPLLMKSDKDLAIALRQHYFYINRKWWQNFKLRGLTTIEFVQFECHRNRFADIRKCPDMPPVDNGDYTYQPGDLMPPVGSAYLLHLFKHPEDYDDELITYLRAPKKSTRLNIGVGWGINLVEGVLAAKVWMLTNLLFGFISLVFAIAWACARADIQGAFGVAQWISALAVLGAGWAQACLN